MTLRIVSGTQYQEDYKLAFSNRASFWSKISDTFSWSKKWDEVLNFNFKDGKVEWFKGGKLNITVNCIDRHLTSKSNDVALIWEPNNPNDQPRIMTYGELHEQVCQFANLLIDKKIKPGDRICIYMPMIPEVLIAMLASARIGAVHSVVFAGFSAEALADRINNCQAKMVITSDLISRGSKEIRVFDTINDAISKCGSIENIILYKRTKDQIKSLKNILIWQEEVIKYDKINKPTDVDSEAPLFILYTSGSTGKPKGVVHTTGGYMVYSAYSFQNVFQYQNNDLFFCTADVGWITGHSYLVYGPLLSGAKVLMFEGVPNYPDNSRLWQIIEKYQVNLFYTAPTLIRSLMQDGDEFIQKFDLKSLRVLGSVGEPINEQAWSWYYEKVGRKRCHIVDTWWQTETGGIMISSLAGINKSNPGFAGLPLPGIIPVLLDDNGKEMNSPNVTGNLCFSAPWPGMMRTVWGDHKKCFDTYFKRFPGYYFSGDGAFKSVDGLFRIIGRVDDVINVSGHRIGTAEIENVVNMHPEITESAVIGFDHAIKGKGICVFAVSQKNTKPVSSLDKEIISLIEKKIGAVARPDTIYIVDDLPKTRSGKIMRRVLKKIINHDYEHGDLSTIVNPDIVSYLLGVVNKN